MKKSILMCPPTYYDVTYAINPWMDKNNPVDRTLAMKQWIHLKETIESCGGIVKLIQPVEGWPDMVFTANAGLVYKDRVWLSHFMFPERQGEKRYFDAWFRENGFEVYSDDTAYEGAGDSLYLGNRLICSYGFRSNEAIYSRISKHILDGRVEVISVRLLDPRFYHLDTTFAPLASRLAMLFPDAHSEHTVKKLHQYAETIHVSIEEAEKFACNAVVIGKHVILPAGNPMVMNELQRRGFMVHPVDVSEFLKSGGACRCLTLDLN